MFQSYTDLWKVITDLDKVTGGFGLFGLPFFMRIKKYFVGCL
jgi:hypothetical protein